MSAVSPKALQGYSFNSLFVREALNVAGGKDLDRFGLLRDQEPYKLRQETQVVSDNHAVLNRSRCASLTSYGACHSLYSKTAEYGEIGGRSGLDQLLRRPVEDIIAQVRDAKVLQVCQPADGGLPTK